MSAKMTYSERRVILKIVYDALLEKKYDPIRQLAGYLLSEDPAYIPDCNDARTLITKIDRDDLLDDLLRTYFEQPTIAERHIEP